MINFKSLYISIAAAACFIMPACSKKLDIPNPNVELADSLWTSATGANQAVLATYQTFAKPGFNWWVPVLKNLCSDEGWSESPYVQLSNTMKFIYPDYNFLAGSVRGKIDDVWGTLYQGVYRANQVVTYVPKINMDETLKNQYIGEAKFLRAYLYYSLITIFGNVPLVLEPNNSALVNVNSTEALDWAQALQDLQDAETALPVTYTGTDVGRVTKGAAYALRAKVYLQLRDYPNAQKELEYFFTGAGSSLYSLMPNYQDNFTKYKENNSESVFEIQYSDVVPFNPSVGNFQGFDLANQVLGSTWADFNGPQGVPGCFSDARARRWPIEEFLKEPTTSGGRDPRLDVTLLYDSTDVRGPDFTMVYGQTWTQRYNANPPDFCWFHKYLNDYDPSLGNVEPLFNSPINYRVIRYADILLMYAECLNAAGSTSDAYQYADQVRVRASMKPLSVAKPGLSQDQFFQQLKHERIVELDGECQRWDDLKRWGELDSQATVDQLAKPNHDPEFGNFIIGKTRVFPIPQQELDLNPSIKQNPGW
ncbi:MAG: RagB/SusD family nutrient uptake outer membrane protein [Chitinophagaceae bacterium]|nr:RagB/SusD family nutrient uptake outer membrane protein [Chitinophagaceae bacterium]